MSPSDFSAVAARQAARAGQLEPWIDRYLGTGAWANEGLRKGLHKQPRWWLGPLEIELSRLSRCCGPEPGMEFCVPRDAWDQKVTALADGLAQPLEVSPLIVEYRAGELSLRDGNHRHEACGAKAGPSAG